MSKLSDSYEQLVKCAEGLAKLHEIETMQRCPQESAMFATLWYRMNELEKLTNGSTQKNMDTDREQGICNNGDHVDGDGDACSCD